MTQMRDKSDDSVRLAIVSMLRGCADYLATLPANEIDALLDGALELRLSVVSKQKKVRKKPTPSINSEELASVVASLRTMDSRAKGEQLLDEVAPTRALLEKLARHLDVAVRREDSQTDLRRRIIESTIGFRLATASIQGRRPVRSEGDFVDVASDTNKK